MILVYVELYMSMVYFFCRILNRYLTCYMFCKSGKSLSFYPWSSAYRPSYNVLLIIIFIIWCIFSSVSLDKSANNSLQIMVCSFLIPSKCVLPQILFCSCIIIIVTNLVWKMAYCFPELSEWLKYENKLGDWMIKHIF